MARQLLVKPIGERVAELEDRLAEAENATV